MLTLVADRAVLGFVILHRDLEHIIAAYTDAVNFGWFVARLGLARGARMLSCVRLAHDRILTRSGDSARSSEASGTGRPQCKSGTRRRLRRHASNGSATILRFGGSCAFDRAADDGEK
jgi:hypothetical protein